MLVVLRFGGAFSKFFSTNDDQKILSQRLVRMGPAAARRA